LTRSGHTSWSLETLDFKNGPFLEENDTDTTLTLNAVSGSVGKIGQLVDVVSSSALFNSSDVGRWIKIRYVKDGTLIAKGARDYTGGGQINGPWDVDGKIEATGFFLGVNEATEANGVELQYSIDGGTTWEVYDTFLNANSTTRVTIEVELNSEDYNDVTPQLRLRSTGDTYKFTWNIRYVRNEYVGLLKIQSYTSSTSVQCKVMQKSLCVGKPLKQWALGVWSDRTGWPSAITFHQDRLFFGGSPGAPQKVTGSRIANYEDFREGTEDDEAVSFDLAANEVNVIKWMNSKSGLVVGTEGGEWVLNPGQTGPITPTNVFANRETDFGSSGIQSVIAEGSLLYVQHGGRNLRQFVYTFDKDSYNSFDISLLAEHMFPVGTEVKDVAVQKRPFTIVWILRSDGVLLSMTMLVDQEVIAWAQHETDGVVESIETLNDELWLIVKRTINGITKRYVERITPWDETLENASFMDCWAKYDGDEAVITAITKANPAVVSVASHGFSNGDVVRITGVSGMTELNNRRFTVANATTNTFELYGEDSSNYTAYTGGGIAKKCTNSISGLGYLEGKTVDVMYDGSVHPRCTVSSGSITLGSGIYGSKIYVGLPYTPVLQTLDIELENADTTIQGMVKRIINVIVRMYKTISFKMSSDGNRFEEVNFRTTESGGTLPSLYTGDKRVKMPEGFSRNKYIYITQDYPLPLNITALVAEMEVENL
jgi:hypothetical protein